MTDLANHLQTVIGNSLAPADVNLWTKLSPLITTKGLEAALLEMPPTPALEAAIVAQTTELIASRERQIIRQIS